MRKNTLIFAISFVLLIVIGFVFNHLIINEQKRMKEKELRELFTEIKIDRLEENDKANFLAEEETKITRRLDAYKGKDLVGIIYIGEAKGRNDIIEVAFAVDTKKHKIVGMLILENKETPEYLSKLTTNDKFVKQFHNKDMSAKKFTVEATSGATITGDAINNIMQLVRAQYDQDTDFDAPASITFISKKQDFTTLNFTYEFNTDDGTITVVTNKEYEIIEISNPDYQEDAIIEIEANPMDAYIDKIEDNTLTILSKGYAGTLVTTATVADGKISSFNTDVSNETYTNSYNDLYQGGDFKDVFADIVAGNELEAITGATITFDAVVAARDILLAYLEEVNVNE